MRDIDTHTHTLASYTVDDTTRVIVAAKHGRDDLEILDVRVHSADSDADAIQIEPSVVSLAEAQAIADDYTRIARRLGWTPMPDVWW